MKKIAYYLLMMLSIVSTALLNSCKKDNDPVKKDDTTKTGSNQLPQSVKSSTFTGDSTWRNGPGAVDYCLEGVVTITKTLTVDPGTVICAKAGAGIYFEGAQAALVAKGTAENRIFFKSEKDLKGGWLGLFFERSNNPLNEMTYVTVTDGGSASFTGNAEDKGNIQFSGTNQLKMSNCVISNGQSYGILETYSSQLTINQFENNAFKDNSDYPLYLFDRVVKNIGASSSFAGNTKNFIAIKQKSFEGLRDANVWKKQAVPYYWNDTDDLVIGYYNTNGSLTLEAGSTLIMGPGSGIIVGENTNTTGSLTLNGTATEKVRIIGSTDQPGAGKGIMISTTNIANSFTNAVIANGGAAGFERNANILVGYSKYDLSRLVLNNVEINKSAGCGISRGNGAGNVLTTTNVTYTGNASGGACTHD